MLENISDSKCWQKITEAVGITDKKTKKNALIVFIILSIIFIIYYFHDNIKKGLNSMCRGLNKLNDGIHDSIDHGIHSLSSTSRSDNYTNTLK